MIGKTVSHFRILEKLGEGGMGVVYKAEDTRLKRFVALKFLPANLTQEPEARERFVREARTASALDHPNICTIYDIDETTDGRTFICMACYEGATLKKKIEQGALSLEEALKVAAHVAKGLSAAHGRGIIHRDVKPGNIFVTNDGQVKILDFGLATLAGQARLTKTGTTVGTVAYMSPEQARGERLDHQSDIWSFGVVLYEMLTGELPFTGEYEQALLYSILNADPEAVTEMRSEIPEELGKIVTVALAKNRDERYRTVDDMLNDLLRLARKVKLDPGVDVSPAAGEALSFEAGERATRPDTPGPGAAPGISGVRGLSESSLLPSIVVLPFANLSADKEQDYFCDGMTEEIINALAKLEGLRVVARTSAFAFRGMDIDVREIGKRLNVEKLLEGSVRKAGERVRITAQLINVSDGYHLWSERYDREMKDIFSIQDEIARSIAEELRVKLGKKAGKSLAESPTEDLDAYNLYLEGRFYLRKFTQEAQEKAIQCFEAAIKKDPKFAAAYSQLGHVHGSRTLWGNVPPHKAIPKLREAAKKALELDNTLADAHVAIGLVYFLYDWNLEAAEEELTKALELEPNSAFARINYALFLMTRKRYEEGLIQGRLAQKLDPLSNMISAWVGKILAFAGHYEEAMQELERGLALDPNYWNGHVMLSLILLNEGKAEEASAAAEKALQLAPDSSYAIMQTAISHYIWGKTERGDELYSSLKQKAEDEYVPSMFFVWGSLARGQTEEALLWLDRAFGEHDGWLCFYTLVPMLLPDDERFLEKFRRIGFEEG